MAYRIQFKPAALRQFESLPRDVQKRLAPRIDALAQDPYPHGCKKLSAEADLWRIRVGDYRVVYQVQKSVLLILVLAIGHRRDVYR
jgi:mRNA interferase RelE/StbE